MFIGKDWKDTGFISVRNFQVSHRNSHRNTPMISKEFSHSLPCVKDHTTKQDFIQVPISY